MAKQIPPTDYDIPLPFPTQGVDQLTAFESQRPGTCPNAMNVVGFEPSTLRGRGGSRPGITQYIAQQVNGTNSIQDINSFVLPSSSGTNPAYFLDLTGTVLTFQGGGGLPWAIFQAGVQTATGGVAGDTPDAVWTDGTSFYVTTDTVTVTTIEALSQLQGKRTPRVARVTTAGVVTWSTQLPQAQGTFYTAFGPAVKIGADVYFVSPGVGLYRLLNATGAVVDQYANAAFPLTAPAVVPWFPTVSLMADPAYQECGGAQGLAVAGNVLAIPMVKLSGGTYSYALCMVDTSKSVYVADSFIDNYGTVLGNDLFNDFPTYHFPDIYQALPITLGSETLTSPWTLVDSVATFPLKCLNNKCSPSSSGQNNIGAGTSTNNRAGVFQMQFTFGGVASDIAFRFLDDDAHIQDDCVGLDFDSTNSAINLLFGAGRSASGTTTTSLTFNLNTLYLAECVVTSSDNKHMTGALTLNPGGTTMSFSVTVTTGANFNNLHGILAGINGGNGVSGQEQITWFTSFQSGLFTRVTAIGTSSSFVAPVVLSDGTSFYYCIPGVSVSKITTAGAVSWTTTSINSGTNFNLVAFPSGTTSGGHTSISTFTQEIVVTGAPAGTGAWITTAGSATTTGSLGIPNNVPYIADLGAQGTGAVITATAAVAAPYNITAVTLITGGTGYTVAPPLVVLGNSASPGAGPGYGALATCTVSGGAINAVSLKAGGSNYQSGAALSIMSVQGGAFASVPGYTVQNFNPQAQGGTAVSNDGISVNWAAPTFNQTGPIAAIAGGSAAATNAAKDFQRTILLLAVSNGAVFIARNYAWYPVGDGITGVNVGGGPPSGPPAGTGANYLSTSAPVVRSAPNGGIMYYVDGVPYNTRSVGGTGYFVLYDPSTNQTKQWLASTGTLPYDSTSNATPRLICTWNGRTVVSGISTLGQLWFMSRMAVPTDWNYAPSSPSPDQAVSGANPPYNNISDTITALIPYSDQLMVFGGDHSIWILTGDPGAGGRIQQISDELGVAWGSPWAKDPSGNLYFVSNRTGIYRMIPGEAPIRISQQIEQFLINTAIDVVVQRLAWDEERQGLHVFVSPVFSPSSAPLGMYPPTHLFWEQRNNAWWPVQFGNNNHNPLCCHTFYGSLASDRVVLIGSWDGYVRCFNLNQTADDGTAVASDVLVGPLTTKELDSILFKDMTIVLGATSGPITWAVYTGSSAENAFGSAAVFTGTLSVPGRSYNIPTRRAGHALYLKLSSTNAWSLEAIRIRLATQGKVLRRTGPNLP